MALCDVCGNDYDKPLEIRHKGRTGTFDCFECAIHAMAPTCEHCGCRIIGHGVEAQGAHPLLRALRPAGGCHERARLSEQASAFRRRRWIQSSRLM